MPKENVNPWGDAANQAVGALYKYYMSQPTAADMEKMRQTQLSNQMSQRMYDMGVYPGMSSDLQNATVLQNRGADSDFGKLMIRYNHPYSQYESGDVKGAFDPFTGTYTPQVSVGTAPRMEWDKENNVRQYIDPVPSHAVGAEPYSGGSSIADTLGAYHAGFAPVTMEQLDAPNQAMGDVPLMPLPPNAEMRDPAAELQSMMQTGQPAAGTDASQFIPGTNIPRSLPLGGQTKEDRNKEIGKNNISNWINELSDLYTQLEQNQGVISQNNGELSNLATSATTTAPGAFIARGAGTQNQAIRDRINGLNSMIFTALKPTLGLTGTQLDSKAEAEYIKRMMGGVDMDVNATRQLLNTLNRAYGNKDLSQSLQPTDQYSEKEVLTAKKYGITPQEVRRRLNEAGINDR